MKRLSPEEQREARRAASTTARRAPASRPKTNKHARAAAKEAHDRKYLHLECGHLGAREDTDTLMLAFRPDKSAWWCDVEGQWTTLRQENIERIPLPEKAPF